MPLVAWGESLLRQDWIPSAKLIRFKLFSHRCLISGFPNRSYFKLGFSYGLEI